MRLQILSNWLSKFFLCMFILFPFLRIESKEYIIKEFISLDTITNLKSYGSYSPVGDFHYNRSRVDILDEKSDVILRGYINKKGEWIVHPYYSAYEIDKNISRNFDGDYHDGIAVVSLLDSDNIVKWFYIDTLGNKLTDQRLNWLYDFEDGYASVSIYMKGVYYINTKGEFQNRLNFGLDRYKNIFSYKKDGKYGFKRFDGTIIKKAQYDSIEFCGCGYVNVSKDGEVFLLDTLWNKIEDINELDLCDEMINKYSTRNCYLNIKKTISCKYDILEPFSDGLGCVKEKSGASAYLDRNGTEVIRFDKDTVCFSFNNGYAKIMVNKKYGLIDKHKEIVIPVEYDYLGNTYEDGIVLVSKEHKYKFLKIEIASE